MDDLSLLALLTQRKCIGKGKLRSLVDFRAFGQSFKFSRGHQPKNSSKKSDFIQFLQHFVRIISFELVRFCAFPILCVQMPSVAGSTPVPSITFNSSNVKSPSGPDPNGALCGSKTEIFSMPAQLLTRIAGTIFKRPEWFGEWSARQNQQFQTLTHPKHPGHAFRGLIQRGKYGRSNCSPRHKRLLGSCHLYFTVTETEDI